MIEVSNAWKENQRRLLADRVGLCIKVYDGEEYAARIADVPLPAGESAPPINVANILKMTYSSSCGEYSLEAPQMTVDLLISNIDGTSGELWEKLVEWEASSSLIRWQIYAVYNTSPDSYESHLLASLVMYNKSLNDNENIITINLAPFFALIKEKMFLPDMYDLVDISNVDAGYEYDISSVINEINNNNIFPASISYERFYPDPMKLYKPFKQHKTGDAIQIIANSYLLWTRYALMDLGSYKFTNFLVYDPFIPYTVPHSDYIIGDYNLYSYPEENVNETRNFVLETPEYPSRTEGETSFSLVAPTINAHSQVWMNFPQTVFDPFGFYINVPVSLNLKRLGAAGCVLANNSDSAVSGVTISLRGYFSDGYEQSYMSDDAVNSSKTKAIYNELGIKNQNAGDMVLSLDGPSYQASFRADPRLECGDYVILAAKRKKIVARVLKLKYEYNGAWKGSATLRHVEDVAPLALIADDTMFLTNALT